MLTHEVNLQALASAKTPEGAAALLNCSKQNVHVLMGNLEFELGRFIAGDESGQRIASSDEGKLKLTQMVKKEMQLTPAGGQTIRAASLASLLDTFAVGSLQLTNSLSHAGRLLQRYSHRMIALAADALAAMRDLQNVKTGQMAVAASQTTGVYLMPPLIGQRLLVKL